jgi:flavin-binding protein dodecin
VRQGEHQQLLFTAGELKMTMTNGNTYKVVELVGTSSEGLQPAIENAISRASQTLKGLDWFEVKEIRGNIQDGNVAWFQVKLGIGFRVLDPADLEKD